MASSHITNSFGFLVGSYRRRQGQKEGKEAGSRKIKERGGDIYLGTREREWKGSSCLAQFSLSRWERESKTESLSYLVVESKEVII